MLVLKIIRQKEGYIEMDKLYKIDDYELLNQKVYKILKLKIIKGNIKPGSKLLEGEISKELGVSRTPVREALQRLAAEGYVMKTPNQGVSVTEVSMKQYIEVLQVRATLEGLAAYFFAKRSTVADLEELQKNVEKMSQLIVDDEPDYLTYSDLNYKFHYLVLNGCKNDCLKKVLTDIYSQYGRFRSRSLLMFPERIKVSLNEHRKIFDAIKKKDAEAAERLSREHLNYVIEIYLEKTRKEAKVL